MEARLSAPIAGVNQKVQTFIPGPKKPIGSAVKILFFHPALTATDPVLAQLQERGIKPYFSNQVEDAVQLFQIHGGELSLAVIHREGKTPNEGLRLIEAIKKSGSKLPVLLTTQLWTEQDCDAHQNSPMGAHAYLKYPYQFSSLSGMMDAIVGPYVGLERELLQEKTGDTSLNRSSGEETIESHESLPRLETVDMIYTRPDLKRPPSKVVLAKITLDKPLISYKTKGQSSTPQVIQTTQSTQVSAQVLPQKTASIKLPPVPPKPDPTSSAKTPSSPVGNQSSKIIGPIEIVLSQESINESSGLIIEVGQSMIQSPLEIKTEEPPTTHLSSQPALASPIEASIPVSLFTQSTEQQSPSEIFPDGNQTQLEKQPTHQNFGASQEDSEAELEAKKELSYLFDSPLGTHFLEGLSSAPAPEKEPSFPQLNPQESANGLPFSQEWFGDSLIPTATPDQETLKHYLILKEQDVAILSSRLKTSIERIRRLGDELTAEKKKNQECSNQLAEQKKMLDTWDEEKHRLEQSFQEEVAELKFQVKAKTDQAKSMEYQTKRLEDEMKKLKERVKLDLRRIRMREKELENRLEIIKKDSEVLIGTRESKIIELKRKLDLLEFNLDLLQDQYGREKEVSEKLQGKISKAAQVVRVAGGLLSSRGDPTDKEEVPPVDLRNKPS